MTRLGPQKAMWASLQKATLIAFLEVLLSHLLAMLLHALPLH